MTIFIRVFHQQLSASTQVGNTDARSHGEHVRREGVHELTQGTLTRTNRLPHNYYQRQYFAD